jgi:hypothetical protein
MENLEEKVAVSGISRTLSTLADGTVRLKIDFEPCDRETAMKLFGEPGTPIAIVPLSQEAAETTLINENLDDHEKEIRWGGEAKELKLSSFFRTKSVWKKIGTDDEYLSWLREQSCAFCKSPPNEHKPIEAAHVRRVASGAGTGIKPQYSAIPLCHKHHAEQHQHGESILGGELWFDRKRIEYISRWGWESLKKQLGYDSWAQVPPEKLCRWAAENGVNATIPPIYYEKNN